LILGENERLREGIKIKNEELLQSAPRTPFLKTWLSWYLNYIKILWKIQGKSYIITVSLKERGWALFLNLGYGSY
jgi:hypothetical protein